MAGMSTGYTGYNPMDAKNSRLFGPTPLQPSDYGPPAVDWNAYNKANAASAGTGDLLNQYRTLFDTYRSSLPTDIKLQGYTPQTYNYTPSQNYLDTVKGLTEESQTGGYSAGDIQNLRERATSPITSTYASANRDVERARALQGGFSPSYNALKAKMARESSAQMAKALTDANAGIAEKVASGKAHALDELASTTASESALRNQYARANIDAENEAAARNADLQNQAKQLQFQFSTTGTDTLQKLLEGMKGLYGTNPALLSSFVTSAGR